MSCASQTRPPRTRVSGQGRWPRSPPSQTGCTHPPTRRPPFPLESVESKQCRLGSRAISRGPAAA
eukprot:scaffold529_cov308-Pinguiococcus_pyrenoidosus.AAC.31